MEHLRCWDDLEQFGVSHRGGERCGLGMRLMLFLDDNAKKCIEEMLDVTITEQFGADTWMIMVPRGMFSDLAIWLAVWNRWEHVGVLTMWENEPSSIVGVKDAESDPYGTWERLQDKVREANQLAASYYEEHEEYKSFYPQLRVYTPSNHPGTGLTNMHMFTGRV